MKPSILSPSHYHPFGMGMPGRQWESGSEYRYGFNGKEQDNETYGEGNIYDYGFRIYNPRLGKFLSVDPLTKDYAAWAPYTFAMNQPIWAIDLDGLERYIVIMRTFIPQAKLDNPAPSRKGINQYLGDNRYVYDYNSNNYRTEQKAYIDFDLRTAKRINNEASGSTGVDREGNVIMTSETGMAGSIKYNKEGFKNGIDNYIKLSFEIDAVNEVAKKDMPMGSGFVIPKINAEIQLVITPNEDGSFGYNISGSTDAFPAYELFVNDVDNDKTFLLLNSNPIESGNTPNALFGKGKDNQYEYKGNSKTSRKGEKFTFYSTQNTTQTDE